MKVCFKYKNFERIPTQQNWLRRGLYKFKLQNKNKLHYKTMELYEQTPKIFKLIMLW